MHIANIFTILKNRHLHNISYYILVNLSISDVLTLVTTTLRVLLSYGIDNEYFYPILFVFYYSSILSTVLMSLDRYIAIKHCIRYRQIVTIKRFVISIITSWIFSIVLNLIFFIVPKILRQNLWYFQIGREVTRCVIMFGSCIILVFLSIQMLHIRRTHVKALVKEKRRFGVEKERLDTLQKLKQSIKDIFRLNVVTAFLVVLSNIAEIFHTYNLINGADSMLIILTGAYFFSNPFLYCLTMSGLRTYYYSSFRRIVCNNNRIGYN